MAHVFKERNKERKIEGFDYKAYNFKRIAEVIEFDLKMVVLTFA